MDGENFKYIDCNQAAIYIYGYQSREETLGKTPLDVSAERQYDGQLSSFKVKANIDEAIEKGQVVFEWLHQRPNGEFWDAEVHLMSFYSGDQLFLQFNLKDITESKKVEKELKESVLRFKTLSSIASEGLIIHENGIIVDLNQTFTKLLGYKNADDLIGKEALGTIPLTPDSKLTVYEHFKSKSDATFDIEITNQNGEIIPCVTRGTEIVYKGRKANLVYMCDISDRKNAEKALKEIEGLFKNLIDLTPYGITLRDTQCVYLMVNKAFCNDWGFEAHEVVGKQKEEIGLSIDDDLVELMKIEIFKKGYFSNIEGAIKSSSGNILHFLLAGRIMQMNNQNVILTSSVNITEKKLIEKELEKY